MQSGPSATKVSLERRFRHPEGSTALHGGETASHGRQGSIRSLEPMFVQLR
jgi:hypothetical protein